MEGGCSSTVVLHVRRYLVILEDCKPWKPVLSRFFLVMGFYLLSLFMMSVMIVVAGIRYPKQSEVLPDLGFDLTPAVHSSRIPNTILTIGIVSTALRMTFHKKGITILRRFMVVHAITALMRGLTMVATSYPDPSLVCNNYEPPSSFSLFWQHTLVSNLDYTCGDLMFSGHTLFYVIIGLLWHKYTYLVEKCVMWFVCLLGCVSLIVTRLHYTNDVIIAAYFAATTWYIYHMYATDPVYRKQWFILNWLEEDFSSPEYEKCELQTSLKEGGCALSIIT